MTDVQRYFRMGEDLTVLITDFSYDDPPGPGEPFILVVPAGQTLRVVRDGDDGWIELEVPGLDGTTPVPATDAEVGSFVAEWPGEPVVNQMDYPTAEATYPDVW